VKRRGTKEEIRVRVGEGETRETGRTGERYKGEQCTYNISYNVLS
jgi:hypothetical protein